MYVVPRAALGIHAVDAAYTNAGTRTPPSKYDIFRPRSGQLEPHGATSPIAWHVSPPLSEWTTTTEWSSAPAASSTALAASSTALKAVETTGGVSDSLAETLKTGSFFALWYMFNIGYNIYNKRALNVFPMPWTIATFQLFAGIPYVLLLWSTGVRKTPKLTQDNLKTLFPVALGHLGTHIGAVISLGAGAVSFTHIVKASEPVVSAALSAVMLGSIYHPITYLTLVPIVGGVALASLKELSFTWLG